MLREMANYIYGAFLRIRTLESVLLFYQRHSLLRRFTRSTTGRMTCECRKGYLEMKLIPRWHFFLSALCCTFLAVSFFVAGGGITYAAPRSSSVSTKASIPADSFVGVERDYNCQGNTEVVLWSSGNPVCFILVPDYSSGYANINVYDVTTIHTGAYNLTFDWTDCNGHSHNSAKPSEYVVTAANSPGGFGGCNYIQDVTFIDLY